MSRVALKDFLSGRRSRGRLPGEAGVFVMGPMSDRRRVASYLAGIGRMEQGTFCGWKRMGEGTFCFSAGGPSAGRVAERQDVPHSGV